VKRANVKRRCHIYIYVASPLESKEGRANNTGVYCEKSNLIRKFLSNADTYVTGNTLLSTLRVF